MRWITYLGFGLLVVGSLAVVASSGAFDSTVADRGVAVETAGDEDALLGLEYPSEERVLELESENGDLGGFGFCFFGCPDYEYDAESVVVLEDNTPSGPLSIEDVSFSKANDEDDIIDEESLRREPAEDGFRVVLGDFSCPTSGDFSPSQQESDATVTVAIEVSDGEVSIDLEREIDVECVPD
ncbi:hypothetical protein [Natronorubrum halophilum]|uniref:hypothetical protein n=1 Tax=Natronorubrum halophilum TaxID=1702106 RepID=UPI000EF72A07|nr:hypothetical protein [Natronorubrum halophilum]